MRTLIIGGAYSGKLKYALENGIRQDDVLDGETMDISRTDEVKCIYRFHVLVKRLMAADINVQERIAALLEGSPDITVICDEIGCGIIPMEKSDRLWREETGKACCLIAEHSDRVVRIFCGIPTVIKGE